MNAFRTHTLLRLHKHLKSANAKSVTINAIASLFGDLKSSDTRPVIALTPNEFVSTLTEKPAALAAVEVFDQAARKATPENALPPYRMWFDLTPEAISALSKDVMESKRSTLDAVADKRPVTTASTIFAIASNDAALASLESMVDFPQHVSTDKAVRDASAAAATELAAFDVEQSMRVDVYNALEEFAATEEAAALVGEPRRMLEKSLKQFRRNGLQLASDKQAELKELKTKMSALAIQFSKNLGEENATFEFTDEQLQGLSDSQLARFPIKEHTDDVSDSTTRLLTLSYPHIYPVMQYCRVPETRQKMDHEFQRRCIDTNSKILEELVSLRHREANLLSFKNHAHFMLDILMAKDPATVRKFIEDISTKMQPLADAEMAELLELKQEECKKLAIEFDHKINSWDFRYYLERRKESKYQVDDEQVRLYFPLDVVLTGMLGVYEDLLSLKFTCVEPRASWHEDVKVYEVRNRNSSVNQQEEDIVGWFFFDLHPREGKYGHAACFGLQPVSLSVGQKPAAACVANFTKPTATIRSTLTMREVVTLFHELGHVFHQVCSKTSLSYFAGTRVERDFVEAPSQMLERFCFRPEVLLRISKHVKTGEKMPSELVQKIVAAKEANVGLLSKRQFVFALYDQRLHSQGEADTASEFAWAMKEVLGIEATPDTNFGASFGHLAGGYSARYYGYMFSEVYAEDMFETVFGSSSGSVIDPVAGASYRKEILEVGGSRDAMDSLCALLGREPSTEAFLKAKGCA